MKITYLVIVFALLLTMPAYAVELDENADGALDLQKGGLGQTSWAQYAIPYCSTASAANGVGVFSAIGDIVFDGTNVEVQDNQSLCFGNDADVCMSYDETTDDRLEFTNSAPVSFPGGIVTGPSTTPGVWFADSDCPGTDKDAGNITMQYVDGADGSENADMIFSITQGGAEDTEVMRFDESDDAWETGKNLTCTGVVTITQGTGPTVDGAGEVAIDTSGNQLVYYGGAAVVVDPEHQETMVIESPEDADNFMLMRAPYGITITNIHCIVDPAGTGESVVIDVQERDGTGDNPATVDATITCDNDGATDDGTFTNGAIDAGDWVSIDIGTVTGTVTQVAITVEYTITRE